MRSLSDLGWTQTDRDRREERKGATMKTCKKLKDYLPIPSTPPPGEKRERALLRLEDELEHERKYLCALCMENKELEEILINFDKEIAFIKSNFPEQIVGDKKLHASNEYWFKYESQMELIRKLEREKRSLESEIRQIEEHGMINLDSLSQSELIMYVKQLERTKMNLQSDLRSKEWGLDKQARDIHHLNEMKRALQAEIRHYDKEFSLFRHYKRNACPSASPTGRRNSCGAEEKRLRMWKQREKSKSEEPPEKVDPKGKESSLSQEDVNATDSKTDVMFSSLDETKLGRMDVESPTPSFPRRTTRGAFSERRKPTDLKKTPVRKTMAIGSLPELSKVKSKSPSPRTVKTKRVKGENKVKRKKAPALKADENKENKGEDEEDEEKEEDEKKESTTTATAPPPVGMLLERKIKKSKRRKSDVFTFDPATGKQFLISIRVIGRLFPNATPTLAAGKEGTTILPAVKQ